MAIADGARDTVDNRGQFFQGDSGLLLRLQQYAGNADLRGAWPARGFDQREQP